MLCCLCNAEKRYVCPYDTSSNYEDIRSVFQHCTSSTTNAPTISTAVSVPIFGDTLLQVTDHTDARPIYDLPGLTASQSVSIQLDFPRPTDQTTPSSFILTLLDSSNNELTQSAPFGVTNSINPLIKDSFSTTWTVGSDGNYRIRVDRGDSGNPGSFVLYDLLIQSGGTLVQ